MADLRVKLFLDLVNRTKAGAEAARRDLASVKTAAEQLRRARAGEGLRGDLARAAKEARVARDALAGTVAEGRRLARTGPGQTLRRDLAAAAREARLARQALAGTVAEGQRLARVGPGQVLRRDLARIALEARRAKDELRRLNREASAPRRLGVRTPDKPKRTGRQRGEEPPAEAARGGGIVAAGRGMIAAVGGYIAARAAVRGTVGNAVAFEAAMADVKKKVDLPDGANWEDLEKTISQNAMDFGRKHTEIAGLVAEAGAAGVAFDQLIDWTKLATRASVAWDMSAQDTSQRLAQIRAGTGMTIQQLAEFVDKVNWLGDSSAATEADIVEMFGRAGSAAKAANVPIDVTLASLTALRAVGMQEEVSARFFNAFASSLRIATNLPKKAAAGFKMLGTSAAAVEKGMKTDALGTMLDLLIRLEKSPDKASAAIKIFGQQWWDEAARMTQAMPEMIRLLNGLAERANWQGSSQKAVDIQLATTENHLKRFGVLVDDVGIRLSKWTLPPINKGIEEVIDILERADELAEKQARGDYSNTPGQNKFNKYLNYIVRGEALSQSDSEIRAARKPLEEREALESHRASLVNEEDAARWALDEYERGRGGEPDSSISRRRRQRLQDDLSRKRQTRIDFDTSLSARDEANLRLAEVEGELRRATNIRIDEKQPPGPVGRSLGAFGLNGALPQPDTLPKGKAPFDRSRFNMVKGVPDSPFDLSGPKSPATAGTIKPIDIQQWINPTVDLGPTIMQQLASSIDAGRGQVEGSARQAGDGIRAALSGVDLSGQGQAIMGSLAAGIAQGGERAVAEAQRVASRVRGAMAGAGGGRGGDAGLSGALHDGVTEN